jgi:hypothetical protein
MGMSEDKSATVCPWCQTEIVWDEEVGPEETCPHCFNELNDYRSLHVHLDGDDLELTDDDDDLTELNGYEAAVKKRLEQQEDGMECVRCQDEMVLAGAMKVEEGQFVPVPSSDSAPGFLKPPFRMNMFVCPSCFQVSYSLSDEDRVRLVNQWSNLNKDHDG